MPRLYQRGGTSIDRPSSGLCRDLNSNCFNADASDLDGYFGSLLVAKRLVTPGLRLKSFW
jgi:hypothetical protein